MSASFTGEAMNLKRILGIIILIAGISMYLFSNYITEQVHAGKNKISKAQKQINQANTLFSLNPVAKEVGKQVTDAGQEKIKEGEQQVQSYEQMAHRLYVGGIAAVILGAGIVAISLIKKAKT